MAGNGKARSGRIAAEILKRTGADVDFAEDGQACLDRLEAAPPGRYDLILMDIRMPNLDGIEATRRIRRLPDPGRARVPIVAMTANVYEKDRTAAFEAGMDAFVEKPIAVDRLLATLSRYLSATECERPSNL